MPRANGQHFLIVKKGEISDTILYDNISVVFICFVNRGLYGRIGKISRYELLSYHRVLSHAISLSVCLFPLLFLIVRRCGDRWGAPLADSC